MAKFPITEARQELGVTPTRAVRANIDTRTGAGAVGAAIGQAGLAAIQAGQERTEKQRRIREAIDAKRQQMTDDNLSVRADKIRKLADEERKQFQATAAQEEWEEFTRKQTERVSTEISAFDFSPEALVKERLKSETYSAVSAAKALTAATLQLREDTIEAQTEAMTEAFRTGGAKEQLEAITRYRDNGANMGKDKVEVLNDIKAAREAGQKLRKQDVLNEWQDKIAEFPQAVEDELNAELEARKTGKGTIAEKELASSDIQSLINLANAREIQLLADTQAEKNRIEKEEENRLYDGLADGTSSVTDVSKNKLIPAAAKRRLIADEGNFAQRDIDKNWPLTDNITVVDRLESFLTSMEAGALDRTQLNQKINEAAVGGGITKETLSKFRGLAKKGGRDAVDIAVKVGTDTIRNALLRRFTERQARTIARSLGGELTAQEQREAGSNAYLLQINEHQLSIIEKEIKRRIDASVEGSGKGRDVVSGNEANKIIADVWEGFRGKPLGDKIADFKAFSTERIPRPSGFPSSRWEKLNDVGKAAVVEAAARGDSNEQILRDIDF